MIADTATSAGFSHQSFQPGVFKNFPVFSPGIFITAVIFMLYPGVEVEALAEMEHPVIEGMQAGFVNKCSTKINYLGSFILGDQNIALGFQIAMTHPTSMEPTNYFQKLGKPAFPVRKFRIPIMNTPNELYGQVFAVDQPITFGNPRQSGQFLRIGTIKHVYDDI